MTVTVTYTQLNERSALRETFHDDKQVSVETLSQREIPFQVQRLMLMELSQSRYEDEPVISTLVRYSPQEIYQEVEEG